MRRQSQAVAGRRRSIGSITAAFGVTRAAGHERTPQRVHVGLRLRDARSFVPPIGRCTAGRASQIFSRASRPASFILASPTPRPAPPARRRSLYSDRGRAPLENRGAEPRRRPSATRSRSRAASYPGPARQHVSLCRRAGSDTAAGLSASPAAPSACRRVLAFLSARLAVRPRRPAAALPA